MLTLSPSAVEVVDTLLSQDAIPEDAGLRIAPAGPGLGELAVGIAEAPAPGDEVIEQGGARVFVDPEAAPIVNDAELQAQPREDGIAFGLTPQGAGGPNGSGPA